MRACASRAAEPPRPRIRRIGSWEDVAGLVEHFSHHRQVSWLFRGVSDSTHDLVPLIGRPDWREPDPGARRRKHRPYSVRDERAVFAMFQNIDVWADYKRSCIPQLSRFGTAAEIPGFHVMHGKEVLEARPQGADKGAAVVRIWARLGRRGGAEA